MQQSGPVDQQAWKRLRPVLATTLIPVAAAGGFFALATYAKRSPSPADAPSMAAFDACLSANGLQPQPSYPSRFDETVAAQQELQTCGDKVPAAVMKKWQGQAEASQSSLRDCVRELGGSSGPGFGRGRFGGGGANSFRDAMLTCRQLLAGGATKPAPKQPLAKPVAPVA